MQTGKNATASLKETAANVGASAKSGMEKTKAFAQEKVEKMTSHDPLHKEMATEKKEGRIAQAELEKLEARDHNAAVKQEVKGGAHTGYPTTGTGTTGTHATTGATGHPTGTHHMSTMPGHGTEQPTGRVIERTEESRIDPGLGRTTAHNVPVGGTGPTYGTGGH